MNKQKAASSVEGAAFLSFRGLYSIIHLRQHRTIPALRLKHRSGSCGTASALPKCSIMSGCGTRIVLRGKSPRTLRPLPLLRFAVSATGGAHLCSIQYYLRFWLGICRTSLAVSALRIMRYCPNLWFSERSRLFPTERVITRNHHLPYIPPVGAHIVRQRSLPYVG